MLILRVTAAVLFGAFALWSQTPAADLEGKLPESAAFFSLKASHFETEQIASPVSPRTNPFALKLDQSHFLAPVARGLKSVELSSPLFAADPSQSTPTSKAASLSKGYFTRRKIHKYASIATLPLLTAEVIVGEKLLDDGDSESSSLRSAHSGLAAGVGVLFGVETVTGIWNMLEARRVTPTKKKWKFHGILMLAADAGLAATAATAPGGDEGERRDASAHKAIAYTTLGVTAFGYIYALIAK
jgi:hypothetical protein